MATLLAILEIMADEYGLGRRGTNSGTSTSALTDAPNLSGADGAQGIEVGSEVLCTLSNDNNAPEGEVRRISSKPKQNTGVANILPVFSAALDAASTYIILKRGLRFIGGGHGLVDMINAAQKDFGWHKRFVPITSITDGDMLGSGVGDWDDNTTSGTIAKVAATFPQGERAISVTAGAATGDYIGSSNIFVEELVAYYLEVVGWGVDANDSGELKLIDVTNSNAEITLDQKTIDRMEPEVLTNTVTMPSGCKEIEVRLVCDANLDVLKWGYVIFRKAGAREWTIQDRPVRPQYLGRLLKPASIVWGKHEPWTEIVSKPESVGAGLWRYTTDRHVSGSLWYEEFISPADMSLSTTLSGQTTPILERELAAVAAAKVLKTLQFRSKDWATLYKTASEDSAAAIQAHLIKNQTIVTAPSPAQYRILSA